MNKSVAGSAARVLVMTSLSIAALEVAGRYVIGLGKPLLYEVSSNYGYGPKPRQRIRRFFANVHINEFGMRSDDYHEGKGVLFIGDSVTFGTTYVDQSEIFTSLIQQRLRSSERDTPVWNASAGGWAVDNEVDWLTSKGTFQSKCVVIVLNLYDLVQERAALDLSSVDMPTKYPNTAIGELFSRYLWPRVRARVQEIQTRNSADPGSYVTGDPDYMNQVPRVLDLLTKANRAVMASGARLLVAMTPVINPETREHASGWSGALAALEQRLRRESIPLIDLSFALSTNPEVSFFDGIHLKPSGHVLVTDEIIKNQDFQACLRT